MGREKEVIKQTGRRRGALCEQGPGGPRPSSLRGDVAGVFTEGREHVSQAGALEQVDNARGQEGQPKSPGAGWQWLCGVESTSATDSFLNAAWALRDFGRRIGHCQRRRVCTQSVETHTEAPHLEHLRGPPHPRPPLQPKAQYPPGFIHHEQVFFHQNLVSARERAGCEALAGQGARNGARSSVGSVWSSSQAPNS